MIFLIDWLQKKAEGTKRELLTVPKAEDLVVKPEVKKEPRTLSVGFDTGMFDNLKSSMRLYKSGNDPLFLIGRLR